MKNLRLFLDDETDEDLVIGLLRMAKDLPAHQFFFELNRANPGCIFARISDFRKEGKFYNYSHLQFRAYHRESKNCVQIISNRSAESHAKAARKELFWDEDDMNILLPFHQEVDYIVKISDNIADFSLILWPENLMFPIQNYILSSTDELSELIQYYE